MVATKSNLKLSNYSTTAAMNGSIASANNATLATVAANYGLKTVVDQRSLDIAARIAGGHQGGQRSPGSRHRRGAGLRAQAETPPSRGQALKAADSVRPAVGRGHFLCLLGAVTTAALDAALLGKADASALAALLSTVDGLDTPLDVDTKILLGLATKAFVAAQADATLLASYATNAALSRAPSTQSSARSLPPCSFPAAELLTRRPGGLHNLGAPSRKQRRSQPALHGSSLLRWPTATTR